MGDFRGKKANNEFSSSSSSSTSSFCSDDETDTGDLKPIKGYLSNRKELARQLFRSVKSDKIRMMLPQILKNMSLGDLEEWCASELSGMSEARILCILNGQTMLNSSDTSDSNDSGPSLEIISDTEEWLTDTDIAIKEEPGPGFSGAAKSKRLKSAKSKVKANARKKNEQEKSKGRVKAKGNATATVDASVKIKNEKDNRSTNPPNKEGESLLDLLELEMRARAIRALIRKEEDIIPSEATEKRNQLTTTALRNTLNSAVSASLSNERNLNGKFNIAESTKTNETKNPVEKSPSKTTAKNEETADEDVVFVVAEPTPTIELLSSDSEHEDTKKEKAAKRNDEESQTAKPVKDSEIIINRDNGTNERVVTIDKSVDGSDNLKIVITKKISESSSSPKSGKSSRMKKNEKIDKASIKIVDKDKSPEKSVATNEPGKGLFKKIKRKQFLRSNRKNLDKSSSGPENSSESPEKLVKSVTEILTENKTDAQSSEISTEPIVKLEIVEPKEPGEISESDEKEVKGNATATEGKMKEVSRSVSIDEDRLDDFEEIINLDDYSDDMEDMESNNKEKKSLVEDTNNLPKDSAQRVMPQIINDEMIAAKEKSTETWASRYYQTDDVQNVIKESKIQSEIRKRLRERQRLSKLNTSPKRNSPIDSALATDKSEEPEKPKPTGSVQEYLALKNSTLASNEKVEKAQTSPDNNSEDQSKNVQSIPTNESPIVPQTCEKSEEMLGNVSSEKNSQTT